MTYRERRLARAERLRDWAEKRARKAHGNFKRAHDLIKDIPLGQPILVGHHSERRHRRTLEKSDNAMRAAVESQQLAGSMASRADHIEAAAEHAIYSDDPDAVERLIERIAELEAERARNVAENKAFRKGDQAFAAFLGISLEAAAARRVTINEGYSWCRQPHPSYSLQNLSGNLNRQKKRLAFLQGKNTRQAKPAPDGATATARAGLTVIATMTTPSRPGKQPRPVWNVTGDFSKWRPMLIRLGGNFYRGVFSFWEDPTEAIERACLELEAPASAPEPTPADPCEGRTIWNSDGTDGPVLICPPPSAEQEERNARHRAELETERVRVRR